MRLILGISAALLIAAAPQARPDFQADAALVAFARTAGPATASGPGPDADRYLVVERDAAKGELVVTSIGVVAHGAPLPGVKPEAAGVIRTAKAAPSAADAAYADSAGIPLFIVDGRKVWELGRQGQAMRVRMVAPSETAWKPIG